MIKLNFAERIANRIAGPRNLVTMIALGAVGDADMVPDCVTAGDVHALVAHYWRMGAWFGIALCFVGTGLLTLIVGALVTWSRL